MSDSKFQQPKGTKRKAQHMSQDENFQQLQQYKHDFKLLVNFRGTHTITWGWLMYLQNDPQLAPKMCMYLSKKNWMAINYDYGKKIFKLEAEVLTALEKCQKRFFVGLLYLYNSEQRHAEAHANAMIFDLEKSVLIRYEPHGNDHEVELDSLIRMWLHDNLGTFTYIPPNNYCPRGPQTLEALEAYTEVMQSVAGKLVSMEFPGYCTAWSLMFLHERLKHPDESEERISDRLLNKGSKNSLSQKIREYATFIVSKVDLEWENKINDVYVGQINNTYHGVLLNSIREGLGYIMKDNGDMIRGHFVNGALRTGLYYSKPKEGELKGIKVKGEFVNGVLNGRGVLIKPNGDRIKGHFVDGELNGVGIYSFKNGDKLIGKFTNGIFGGYGEFKQSDRMIRGKYMKINMLEETLADNELLVMDTPYNGITKRNINPKWKLGLSVYPPFFDLSTGGITWTTG